MAEFYDMKDVLGHPYSFYLDGEVGNAALHLLDFSPGGSGGSGGSGRSGGGGGGIAAITTAACAICTEQKIQQ